MGCWFPILLSILNCYKYRYKRPLRYLLNINEIHDSLLFFCCIFFVNKKVISTAIQHIGTLGQQQLDILKLKGDIISPSCRHDMDILENFLLSRFRQALPGISRYVISKTPYALKQCIQKVCKGEIGDVATPILIVTNEIRIRF